MQEDFSASKRASAPSFFGKFRQKVDAKGRLTLPAIHRRALEDCQEDWLVLRKDAEGFVQIVPRIQWAQVLADRRRQDAAKDEAANEGATKEDAAKKRARVHKRKWTRRVESTDVDAVKLDLKGRITVPQELLSHGGISKDVMVLGVGSLLELWDPQKFFEAAKQQSVDPEEIDDLLYG